MKEINIFLIEDSATDAFLVREALKTPQIPHNLLIVEDGETACAHIKQMGLTEAAPCPDLVLLDLHLPRVDGLEILSLLRQQPACAHTPVIVMSSDRSLKARARLDELHVTHFFEKSIHLDSFLTLGNVVLEVVQSTPT